MFFGSEAVRILGLAAKQRKADIFVRVFNHGLAGKTVVPAQKLLRLGGSAQCFMATTNFDDALVADAGAATRCGYLDGQLVGIVEDGLPAHKRALLTVVGYLFPWGTGSVRRGRR